MKSASGYASYARLHVPPYTYAVHFVTNGVLKVGFSTQCPDYACRGVNRRFLKSTYPSEIGVTVWHAAGNLAQEAYLNVRMSRRFKPAKVNTSGTTLNEWWETGDIMPDGLVRMLDQWKTGFDDLD